MVKHIYSGFEEPSQPPLLANEQPQRWRLKIGADGRVVIPAAARALMELDKDGNVVATILNGKLQLVSQAVAMKSIHAITAGSKKRGTSVVDKFIAERRAEALREEQK